MPLYCPSFLIHRLTVNHTKWSCFSHDVFHPFHDKSYHLASVSSGLTLCHTIPTFNLGKNPLKTWEKEKMLVTSIFCYQHFLLFPQWLPVFSTFPTIFSTKSKTKFFFCCYFYWNLVNTLIKLWCCARCSFQLFSSYALKIISPWT